MTRDESHFRVLMHQEQMYTTRKLEDAQRYEKPVNPVMNTYDAMVLVFMAYLPLVKHSTFIGFQ